MPAVATATDVRLEDAITGATRTHERARIAALNVDVAKGEVESARADFLPALTFGASATVAPDEDGRYVTGGGNVTLRQPLLAPSAIPRLRGAKYELSRAKLTAGEETRILAFDAARAFLDALAAERFVQAADARLTRAKANRDNAQARVDAELNSSNDVTRAKLEVASASRELTERRRDLATARLTLGLLMGTDGSGTLIAPDVFLEQAKAFVGDPSKLSRSAVGARADVKALEEGVLAAKESAKEPLFRLAPSIDLTGRFDVNPDPLPEQSWHDESLTLALTWTIFDGGRRYGDRRSAVARVRSLEAQRSLLERTLSNEVRGALVVLDAARETSKLAEETQIAAAANTDETRVLYQQGLARAIELVDANAEQFDAEIEVASSKVALAKSFLEVRFALGLSPVDGVK